MATAEAIVEQMASRMASLRRERRLSLQEVADRSGLAKSHIWEIEQGRSRNPTIATAVNIASALGVSLDYLTGLSNGEPSMHPEALRIACEVDAIIRRSQPVT